LETIDEESLFFSIRILSEFLESFSRFLSDAVELVVRMAQMGTDQ
jgi:hypothetical protein